LYVKANEAGWTTESWFHRAGCRRYFVVERHRVTSEIRAARPPAAQQRMTVER
jgi:heterotetrameric sarcosine oxidase delta subunit